LARRYITYLLSLTILAATGVSAQQRRDAVLRNRVLTNATGTHYVQWTWTAPTTGTPAAAYNVYQAIGTCTAPSTFTLLGASVALTTWQQAPVPTSTTCTYVTAISAVGVEGPPSASFQLDLTAPGAPGKPTPAYQ
jgi:hypothetical protein